MARRPGTHAHTLTQTHTLTHTHTHTHTTNTNTHSERLGSWLKTKFAMYCKFSFKQERPVEKLAYAEMQYAITLQIKYKLVKCK